MTRKRSSKAKSFRAARGGRSPQSRNKNRKVKLGQMEEEQLVSYPIKPTPTVGSLWYNPLVLGVPDCVRTRLRYIMPFQVVNNAGGNEASLRFTSNAFDVDSSLGSTAMAYFSELATLYARFRTLGIRYKFDVSTLEASSIQYIHGFSSTSIASGSLGGAYAETPYIKQTVAGGVTADSSRCLRGQLTVAELFGSKQALYDDLFTGSTTSSTLSSNATMYVYCGGITVSGTNLTLGFHAVGFVELDIMFYDRNTLLT